MRRLFPGDFSRSAHMQIQADGAACGKDSNDVGRQCARDRQKTLPPAIMVPHTQAADQESPQQKILGDDQEQAR